ncbi:Ndr family protein [Brugia pahangi]
MCSAAEMGAYFQDELPLISDHRPDFEEKVSTPYGNVKVTIYGNRQSNPIVTFHDMALDSETNFQNFFQYATAGEFLSNFCIYNINAPGQEMDAAPLPDHYVYPTMDGLVQIVDNCVEQFKIREFIGLGVGVGANVMLRYALQNQSKMDALILINCVATSAGWIEWFYQQINIRSLRTRGMTNFSVDYLLWHHFGNHVTLNPPDTVRRYRAYLQHLPNPKNLSAFIEAYLNRTPISISRDGTMGPKLNVPVLQIVGGDSAFVKDSVELNARLNPADSEWLKLSGSGGLVLDDKPEGVAQAIILFLQGRGFVPTTNVQDMIRKISVQSTFDGGEEAMTVLENVNEIN